MKRVIRIKLYNGLYRLKRFLSEQYYRRRNKARLDSTGVIYSDDIITNGKLIISNLGSINIGKGVVINSGSWPNPIASTNTRIYTQLPTSRVIIGNNVGISGAIIFAKTEIVIGDGTNIGGDSIVIDTDFHSITVDKDTGMRNEGKSKPIHIGKNVFIGARCFVLKGVTIGDNSVVGAGSVVTRDIPSGEIWAGNPAVFIRKINQ